MRIYTFHLDSFMKGKEEADNYKRAMGTLRRLFLSPRATCSSDGVATFFFSFRMAVELSAMLWKPRRGRGAKTTCECVFLCTRLCAAAITVFLS